MAQSFEALLTQRSSKDTFKRAKSIIHGGEIVCCYEPEPGTLRAVFRDVKGNVSRTEVHGFPYGPYSAECSCSGAPKNFCCHAVAACLYHAKYTIKPQEENVEDTPGEYAGLKFKELSDLLKQVLVVPEAEVTIIAETDFPHMPSKWERIIFQVTLSYKGRQYTGNLNNLRQILFEKTLAAALHLEYFPQQDRQIIRYLAINAQQEGSKLSLDAEQSAEFFHCLIGFQRFFRFKEKVVIHRSFATPALLVEDAGADCVLRSAIIVKGVPLPLKDVKIIAGRAGCWVGMLGEYWWVSVQADVLWVRNFLRTTIQACDKNTAEILLSMQNLPVQVIETRRIKIKPRKFAPYLDAKIRSDGTLELEVLYDYGGVLCPGDQERYAAHGGNFWLRDTAGEKVIVDTLLHFGFTPVRTAGRCTRLKLKDREAIGVFADELLPGWLKAGYDFSASAKLIAICGDTSSLKIETKIHEALPDSYTLAVSLTAGGRHVCWNELAAAAVRNELFMSGSDGSLIKISAGLRRLAAGMADIVQNVSVRSRTANVPEEELLHLSYPAACHWTRLADGIPGAVPVEFLRLKLNFDEAAALAESDPGILRIPLFQGELRNYQKQGVLWISALAQRGCNLVLADEMGLGKTIQTLALLAMTPEKYLPALVICPTSLIGNWAREAAKFTPGLKVLVISGNSRKAAWEKSGNYDICITSYSLIRRDIPLLENRSFRYLILDEAQHIKNPATANAQACKAVTAEHKLVLTGTPLENSPEDLWSIFDFLHGGFLGPLSGFRAKYVTNPSKESLSILASRIAPFMLRRKKADVHRELPPKQEQTLLCEMSAGQRAFYNRFLEQSRQLFDRLKKMEKIPGGSRFEMLSALLRLRQICCAPELLPESLIPTGTKAPASAKMDLLRELLLESIDSGHKVLLFSQFTSVLRLIRNWMDSAGMRYEYLDGSTTNRMEHVDHFNKSQSIPVFLLSLKAGGVGLNLTSADTVILYDPWWNPAAEAQAEDRTHRIGQTKPVNCLKLIVKDSIEEKVLQLQQRKAELFDNLVESPTEAMRNITAEDLEFLLK